MGVNLLIPSLGDKFKDYRKEIAGNSFTWGPTLVADRVNYFAFHHSVTAQTAKNDGNWKAECDYIAWLHIEKRRWAGIGYRFVICSDGTVVYVGDLSHGGSAVAGNNDHIISACFVGNFTKELPTAYQVHSANLLAEHFLFAMPPYPLLKDWSNIIGHKETYQPLALPGTNPTACPGSNWKVAGDSLFERIKNGHYDGYPDPQPPAPPEPDPEPEPPEPDPEPEPPTPDPVPKPHPCCGVLQEAKDILFGKGFWFIKYWKLQKLLRNAKTD